MKALKPRIESVYGEGTRISFLLADKESEAQARRMVDSYKDKTLDLTAKEWKEKRSLTANAYFHALVSKMAAILQSDIPSVKKHLVLSYGVSAERDSIPVTITLPKGVAAEDFYPYCEWVYGDSEGDTYELMKETHMMNTKEFSVLLDGTIRECKELGIETLSPDEIRRLYAQIDKGLRDS